MAGYNHSGDPILPAPAFLEGMIMRYLDTKGVVSRLIVTIDSVSIHKSKDLHQIEVFVDMNGKPEYARCNKLHMTVLGYSIWEECFGKRQTARIERICKSAVKYYFDK
jgi:hypothetical protein